MRIIHEKTVYQLTFLPHLFPVNCYFVEEEDGLTLIDAALPYSWKKIIEAADSIGKKITKIILTHAHEDHVGSLDALKKAIPDIPIYISKRDAKLMTGDCTLELNEPNLPIRGAVPKKLKTRANILLKEGDKIGSLIAISAQGHTPGSMAFLDTRNNSLIAGDAFQTRGGIAVAGQLRLWFPFPAMATWNKQAALESARKLRGYFPSLLAAGHGPMLKQPVTAMDGAIARAEQNLENTK
ncbi:MBL fold metallo-hydrolase [Clostridium pasteurianum]|uniref:Zn-dependent hydrolase, glyoxylase n=1 Tax=Clostridium pasteurianum BC1 TaxID=86416 RepID=R4K3P9_CLOPA|nr:MBL fold metallo-hydrolase [Clostridium pasteurianum]AGK97208.1 Zn-dependent hydrolase, glyoxylase [Clostridium pasteurianum BC1]